MRITIDGQEYRLYFRYKWEQPGGASRPNGTIELRHAVWYEIPNTAITDKPIAGQFTLQRNQLWRTTEAVLAKVVGYSQADGSRPKYEEVAKGITRCSPLDKFDKSVGRNESLRRLQEALRGKGFTGPQLGDIHEAYANRVIDAQIAKDDKLTATQLQTVLDKMDPAAAQLRKELGI